MNSIDEMDRPEKLEKLFRMMANGRIDAALKLAQILEEELQKLEPKPKKASNDTKK